MLERGKTLSAMLRFQNRSFTARDLAEASGAKLATVRSVLARERNWLENLGPAEPTGTPGGRWQVYRLTDEARTAISAELEDLRALSPSVDLGDRRALPTAIRAAEELLLGTAQTPTAEVLPSVKMLADEIDFLRKRAAGETTYVSARVQAHIELIDFLLDFTSLPNHHPCDSDRAAARFVQALVRLAESEADDAIILRALRTVGHDAGGRYAGAIIRQEFERRSPAALVGESKDDLVRQFTERYQGQGSKMLVGAVSMIATALSFTLGRRGADA